MIVIKIEDENNEFGSEQEKRILEFLYTLGIQHEEIKLTVEENDFEYDLEEDDYTGCSEAR